MEERVAMRSLLTFERVWFNWRISWILVTFDSDLSHNSNNSYNINEDSCFKNEKGSSVDSVINQSMKRRFCFHNKWKFKCKKRIILFFSSGITRGFVAGNFATYLCSFSAVDSAEKFPKISKSARNNYL
jgi:hypothetical protein